MNQVLADFLLSLLRDPGQLRRFNTEEGRAEILERNLTLSPDDKKALLSGDSADVLTQLQVEAGEEDQLAWVVSPVIKEPPPLTMVGFVIKGPPIKRSVSTAPSTRKLPGKARSETGTRSRKSSGARKRTSSGSRKTKRSRGKR